MNKYLLILACSLLAIPGFAQQQQINVSTSQSLVLPVATDTQTGLLSAPDHVKFGGMENPANKNKSNGYAGLDANGKFPWLQLSGVPAFQAPLGFTPENPANKNKPNGYMGADSNGLLPWTQISNIPTASATVLGCVDPAHFNSWNAKQNALGFTPENTANKNKANGYAALDSSGKLPWTQLSGVPVLQPVLGFMPENPGNKNKPNGYPGLDANSKILPSVLPAPPVSVWNELYRVPSTATATYTLASANVAASSVVAYRNGLRLALNADYTINGNVVTFSPMPTSGDTFIFDYQHQ